MPARAFSCAVAVAVVVLLAAACGGSSDEPGASGPVPAAPPASSSAASSSASSSPSGGGASPSTGTDSDDVVTSPPSKTWQDALDAARREFDGKVSKIELERQEAGGLEYKIELLSTDTKFAVQYDADSLKKRSAKRDGLGDDAAKKQKKTFDPASVITLDKAVATARQQQDGTITKWKIEGKDTGRAQYEFDVLPRGAKEDVEVQIDANDASVVKDS